MADVAEMFDSGEEGASAPSDKLEILHKHLDEATALEQEIEDLTTTLAALQQSARDFRERRIPELMTELGMSSLVRNGWKVEIKDFVSGSLPKDEEARQKAIKWLDDHEAGDLLKTDVKLQFARGSHETAKELHERLIREGFAASIESGVHAASLQAFARERIKSGEDIDTETLGLYTGKHAKFKLIEKK